MYCRNCGNEISDLAEICVKCGVRPKTGKSHCHNCGTKTSEIQVVCISCGASLEEKPPSPATSGRSKQTALVCAALVLIGLGGVHRLYTGHIGIGIVQLLTFGGCFIWQIVDFVNISSGSFRDVDGKPLS